MAQFSLIPTDDARDLTDDIRELFEELAATLPHGLRAYSGECRPSLDVLETTRAIEIVVDVSGVPAAAIRIVFRAGVVIIAGEKAPVPTSSEHSYHLVERDFGRFARIVRLPGAFDVERGAATISNGELRIVLPKVAERRGRAHRIPLTSPASRTP